MRYPKQVKEQALARMMAPKNEAVPVLSRELNVTEGTLYAWRREALRAGVVAPGDGRNAEAWSAKAKFAVVLESAVLSEAELGEYCRAKGLYPEQVRAWRQLCESAFEQAGGSNGRPQRRRLRELEKELRRKDRALAEAAALLVLRKKAAAIWGESEDE
jgi:transposase-like protein